MSVRVMPDKNRLPRDEAAHGFVSGPRKGEVLKAEAEAVRQILPTSYCVPVCHDRSVRGVFRVILLHEFRREE